MTAVALVTGAGSGIGRQTALALVTAGFHVILTGRRESALNDTLALCPSPERMSAITCDVTSSDSVDALYAQIEAQQGRLDLLFNNAGTNVPAMTIDELTVEQWKQVIDVNLTGAFLAARGAFTLMRKQSPQGGG